MKKYWTIAKISFQQEFAYPLNFVMWRVRNVIQIFLVFFLWDTVFANPKTVVFGYDRAKILTYIFGLIFVRSIVLSIRSIDVAGDISRGDLTNYLLKPIHYLKYWFTRDVASKFLNLLFSIGEIVILYFLLRPPFYFPTNIGYLVMFLISLALAVVIYFVLVFIFSFFTFWQPEQAWGFMFLLMIFTEFLAGGVMPLDVLPTIGQRILYFTPFPYLLFVPLEIYLGKFSILESSKLIAFACLWIVVLVIFVSTLWKKGLKVYRAEGR